MITLTCPQAHDLSCNDLNYLGLTPSVTVVGTVLRLAVVGTATSQVVTVFLDHNYYGLQIDAGTYLHLPP